MWVVKLQFCALEPDPCPMVLGLQLVVWIGGLQGGGAFSVGSGKTHMSIPPPNHNPTGSISSSSEANYPAIRASN